jgi:predicted transposase YbfD/YdcC
VQAHRGCTHPPFAGVAVTEKGHGRIETRRTSVYALCEPAEAGLFGVWTLLKTERTRAVIKTGKTSSETVWHLCTLDARARTALQWSAHVRDHWGIESRNHNRRDCALLEDKTRSRNANVVGNLAVARAALLFFNSRSKDGHLGDFANTCREDRSFALRLLTARNPFK